MLGEIEPIIPAGYIEIFSVCFAASAFLLSNVFYRDFIDFEDVDDDIARVLRIIPICGAVVVWGAIPQIPFLGSVLMLLGVAYAVIYLVYILGTAQEDLATVE